jgi:Flp pilus assembly protein TadG
VQRGGGVNSFYQLNVYASCLDLLNIFAARMMLSRVGASPRVASTGEKNLKIKRVGGKGQISVALILVMTVVLGAVGLGADAAVLYMNWVILQKGVDAAALAGAGYLQSNSQSAPTAINVAVTYAQNNGIKNSELIADGSGNKAYVPGPNYTTITVTAKRTVPYAFFKLIGLSNGTVAASATAQMPLSAGCVNCTSAVATPGSQPTVIPGNFCTTVGQCDVLPIGLDATTPYQFDQAVTLNQGQVGPGNWGSLALGGTGGSNERTNIADGYQGPLAINQWVDTEPGFKKGPVGQGFSDRIAQAQNEFPNGTFDNHSPNDPRAVILPMVAWNSPNGRSQVEIVAFAAVWIDSESGGTIQAHFIQQEAFDSTGSASAPNDGAMGRPILIK